MSSDGGLTDLTSLIVRVYIWGLIAAVALFICIFSFYKSRHEPNKTDRDKMWSWGWFFLVMSIHCVFMILLRYFPDFDDMHFDVFYRSSSSLYYLAIFIKVRDIEKSFNEMKYYRGYYFSILNLISIGISIIVNPDFQRMFGPLQFVFLGIGAVGYLIFPLSYLYVVLKSTGEVRMNAAKIFAGAGLIGLGALFSPENTMAVQGDPTLGIYLDALYVTSPVSILLGLMLIFGTKDVLEELEWRECIHHLFIIHEKGICLLHKSFTEQIMWDRDLMAGGFTGIIGIVQEMTSSPKKLDVLSQEDYKILFKYGKHTTVALITTKNLRSLHRKLEQFNSEFEELFGDFLEPWTGELELFKPAEKLILRYFK